MVEVIHKKDIAIENLETASEKFDPYIKYIREAAPKASDNKEHFEIDLKKKRWKKGYVIFKEWFSWRAVVYGIPAALIAWCFKIDVLLGLWILTPFLLLIIGLLIYYILGVKALYDMTDESKKEYFHYYAYTNHRREYEIFAPYLTNGNNFRFKQALELLKEWDKDIEKKDAMILNLQKDLKETANDAVNLPDYAQEENDFVNALSEKLTDKIERKEHNSLSLRTMDFFGHYAIYKLDEDQLILEHSSRRNQNIPTLVKIDDNKLKNMSYLKILKSTYAWETDSKSTISFVVEVNATIYVYTVIVGDRNRHVLNTKTTSGKMNIERLADVVSTAFKLFSFKVSKI
ncbi:hypothetical protein ACFVSS_06940 [Peribacillus butanolivorans]|uniref:hypothetical protein n=1 Tax=Peribacillus butanolivorans TaxID=421767 RepID=UPI0036DB23C6